MTWVSLPFGSVVQRMMFWLFARLQRTEPCEVDQALQDGETVEALGGLQVIHAPGHTPGNLVLYHRARQLLFCGDTLFAAGCGRLFEGTPEMMFTALHEKLGTLPDSTRVFCGHEYSPPGSCSA